MKISSIFFSPVGRTINTIGTATENGAQFYNPDVLYATRDSHYKAPQAVKRLFPNLYYGLNGKQFVATILAVRILVMILRYKDLFTHTVGFFSYLNAQFKRLIVLVPLLTVETDWYYRCVSCYSFSITRYFQFE